jgi:protein CpxP
MGNSWAESPSVGAAPQAFKVVELRQVNVAGASSFLILPAVDRWPHPKNSEKPMNRFALHFALLGFALGVVSFVPVTFAQDNNSPDSSNAPAQQYRMPDPQKQAARLAKRLGLNDDQTSKLATILQDREQQASTVRNDSSLAPQDRRAKLRSIQQAADTQIDGLLTPDQQKQYAALKQNMRDRRQNARGASGTSGTDSGSDNDGH